MAETETRGAFEGWDAMSDEQRIRALKGALGLQTHRATKPMGSYATKGGEEKRFAKVDFRRVDELIKERVVYNTGMKRGYYCCAENVFEGEWKRCYGERADGTRRFGNEDYIEWAMPKNLGLCLCQRHYEELPDE